MNTEMILCSSLDMSRVEKPGTPAFTPAGPPAITPVQPDASGCCEPPVKSTPVGDHAGSTANETGGKPGDPGPR